MRCLRCRGDQDLVVAIDKGSTSHAAHWTEIHRCGACDEGEIRHFSHDSWHHHEDEEWDMTWSARIAPACVAVLSGALLDCPDPAEPSCSCAAHASLRWTSRYMGGSRIDGVSPVGAEERNWRRVTLSASGMPEVVDP